jgi:ornithine cyclodeaminase/alanine dehydrogenase-like protein (mu-crystallin family)
MVRALNPAASVRVYGGPRVTGPLPGVEVVPDARTAVDGADVVVTAGPMAPDPARRLELSWLGERVLVVPVDFSAYVTAEVAAAADDLVTDDVAQLEHYRGLGHFAGWPRPHRSLGEALDARPSGDLRVSCSLGVGAADAALADVVLRRAESERLGIRLPR